MGQCAESSRRDGGPIRLVIGAGVGGVRSPGSRVEEGGPRGARRSTGRYDGAGNLTFDGKYSYQYDAWNRLLQVNRAHPGPSSASDPVPDEMVKHLAYDGLGRLVRVQSRFPSVETAAGRVRSEWFFYDGIRRIEEVVTDPLVSLEFADGGGGSTELGDAASEYGPDYDADPPAANMAFEQALTDDLLTFPDRSE